MLNFGARKLLAGFAILQLVIPPGAAIAQQSVDLSSEQRCCGSPQAATIQIEGTTTTVSAGQMVTPAELLAIQQVITTGQQTVVLSASGMAIGGTVNLTQLTGVGNLVVPQGVTALYDSANNPVLNITGNLMNAGNFYLYSTNQGVNSATINATNIYNSALLSTILPQGLVSVPTVLQFSLLLNATQSIVNTGSITSSGNLNLNAAVSVINQTLQSATAAAVLSAVNNLTINTPNLTNFGNITALTGNLNLGSKLTQDMAINNAQGILQSLQGTIDINATNSLLRNVSLTGGDVIAQQLNISVPGSVSIDRTNIAALVNVNAEQARIASGDTLSLGSVNVRDPRFLSSSDIIINDLISAGAPVSVVAGRDILAGSPIARIDTSSATGSGGDVFLAAGAKYAMNADGSISILGGTAGGGSIDLNINKDQQLITLSTSGGGVNASGGDLTMLAFEGSRPSSGRINLPPELTATTGGTGSGRSGDVLGIAGSTQPGGSAINTSNINTRGGQTGGAISLYAAKPLVVGDLRIAADGTVLSGKVTPDLTEGGNFIVGNDIKLTSPGDITIGAHGDVILDQGQNLGTGVVLEAGTLASGADTDHNIDPLKVITACGINIRSETGDIVAKRGSSISTVGKDLTLQSNKNITLESDNQLLAYGGNIGMFTDLGDIMVANSSLIKAVGLSTPPECSGGNVIIWTEVPGMTLANALTSIVPTWGAFYQEGSVKDEHSVFSPPAPPSMGYIEAVSATGQQDHIMLHQSGFYTYGGSTIKGGIISLRTPGESSSKNIIFQKSNVIAINECGKKPDPPIPPKPPTPPTPGASSTLQVTPKVATSTNISKVAATPISLFSMRVNEGSTNYAWTVTYAPESYLQATSRAKIVVIGARNVIDTKTGAKVTVAGTEVEIMNSDEDKPIQQNSIVFREEIANDSVGAIALGGSARKPVKIRIGQDTYRLSPGALLLVSREPGANSIPKISCVVPMTTVAALPEPLPESILLQTQQVLLRNKLSYALEPREKLVKVSTPKVVGKESLQSSFITTRGNPIKERNATWFMRNAEFRSISPDRYALSRGSLLAAFDKNTRIDTPNGVVSARKGSVVLLTTSPRLSRIRNLSDHSADSVSVEINGLSIMVPVAKEVNICHRSSDPVAIVVADGLGRRSVKNYSHGDRSIVTADFSILHAVLSQPLLSEISSSNADTSKATLREIMKTAAAVNLVIDRYRGPYYAQPSRTPSGIVERPDEVAL